MLEDFLQDRAVQYVSGAMTATERENFDVLLDSDPELRTLLGGLQETATGVIMAGMPAVTAPPAALKTRLLAALDASPPPVEPDGLVVTDAAGLIQWVNPGFTAMCGYTLAELKGRKPGHLLQGPATDAAAVGRIRVALHARQDCRETLLNYHKDGSPYRVEVSIAAIRDDDAQPRLFVAREWKLPA